MGEFDPLRGAREELVGLTDILATMRRRENAAEEAMSAAEAELNAIRKLRGFCQAEIDRLREKLAKLEAG